MLTIHSSLFALSVASLFVSQAFCRGLEDEHSVRQSILSVADSISLGRFEGQNLNMMGRKPILSEQFRRFVFLADSATTEELFALTRHRSPVVRCYTFDALAFRHPSGFLKMVSQQRSDTAKFPTRFFDMGGFSTVSEHLIESTVSIYLSNYDPDSAEYSFIRALARSKEVPLALVATAKFKRAQDADLISSYLDDPHWMVYGIRAIEQFPADSFFQRLAHIHEEQLSNPLPSLQLLLPLYGAIVQYERPEADSLLVNALSHAETFAAKLHRVALSIALTKHPGKYFDSFRNQINLDKQEQTAVQELLAHPD